MRGPLMRELPAPPPGKTGWPWTEGSEQLPATMLDGSPWPKVSIVTPSYNQGEFVEETIRSVLLQGYPSIEYVIIDGGSTDGSVEVIQRYSRWLEYWVSESDEGQSDAINKGWRVVTGEYTTWLNSDDLLVPGSLASSVRALVGCPEASFVYGNAVLIDRDGNQLGHTQVHHLEGTASSPQVMQAIPYCIPQPTTLIRTDVLSRVGLLDIGLHYAMDYDLFLRLEEIGCALYEPGVRAKIRLYVGTKSSTNLLENQREKLAVMGRYRCGWSLWCRRLRYCCTSLWMRLPSAARGLVRRLRRKPRDVVCMRGARTAPSPEAGGRARDD